jgi:predicted NAD/FAD-dependent oxidoreductase/deoxyribodipyrimidine photolyase
MVPEHLRERTREIGKRDLNKDGLFVLYWMHHALRGHENPALDLAIVTAESIGLPVFVYQGLSERYQYASDRHHAFILAGARDAHQEISSRGIGTAFHLERGTQNGPYLRQLARQAAVVITDDLPTEPITGWVERLFATIATPIWLVDTACVVPMKLVGRFYDRAFAYRNATSTLREKRLVQPWPEQPNPRERFFPRELPFIPVDLNAAEFQSLIAECDIDHTVGPVPHTLGGSRAGYARWDLFKTTKLQHYAKTRNDPLLEGVSRLSAYLHYGMISPFRIAREASAIASSGTGSFFPQQSEDPPNGPNDSPVVLTGKLCPSPSLPTRAAGAEKFLDELLIWRELAYTFCYYHPTHDSLAALPEWATETLREHEVDARPTIFDWETLARGQTGDALWDAAQRSLLMQGELHNNVRMTWGKAFLNWTRDGLTALKLMIDLNHRYALDGRDPASSGGLLWCLGQFDRPHTPPQPIFGTVRSRPTDDHAKRLDPKQYLTQVTRPLRSPMPRIAVIGAGLAGLFCARTLHDHGFAVTIFEKSGGPGGRTSTPNFETGFRFDQRAPSFTVRDPHFGRYVEAWVQQGVVAEWAGRMVTINGDEVTPTSDPLIRYVGVPDLSQIARHLAEELRLCTETQIVRLDRVENGWQLTDLTGQTHAHFDQVVLSVSAPQAAEFLQGHRLEAAVRAVSQTPCWGVTLAFRERLRTAWDAAFVHQSPLTWVARNRSQPGRDSDTDCWVLQGSTEWSRDHLETDSRVVADLLITEFAKILPVSLPAIEHLNTQGWMISASPESIDRQALHDPDSGLTACGDWLCGGGVEGSILSGMSASGYLLRSMGIPDPKIGSDLQSGIRFPVFRSQEPAVK